MFTTAVRTSSTLRTDPFFRFHFHGLGDVLVGTVGIFVLGEDGDLADVRGPNNVTLSSRAAMLEHIHDVFQQALV